MSDFFFTERAIQRVAEDKIRAALEDGKFANLPGAGKPLEGLEETYDPMWWVKRWIQRERLTVEELRLLIAMQKEGD